MNIYIDCEWNGFGGQLLSMALVPADDSANKLYVEFELPENIDPWVAENVIPHMDGLVRKSLAELPFILQAYLSQFDTVNIIADWPEDIERFCQAMILKPGYRIDTPPLSFQIVRVDAVSILPHHALWDAKALRTALGGG